MFYNIQNSIKKDTIIFVVSKKIPIFAPVASREATDT